MSRTRKPLETTLNPLFQRTNPLIKSTSSASLIEKKKKKLAHSLDLEVIHETEPLPPQSQTPTLQVPSSAFRSILSSSDLTDEKKENLSTPEQNRFVKRLRHRSISAMKLETKGLGISGLSIDHNSNNNKKLKPEKSLGLSLNNCPRPKLTVRTDSTTNFEFAIESKNLKYNEDFTCLVAATLEGLVEFSTPGMRTTLTQLTEFIALLLVSHLQFLDDSSKLLETIIARYQEISNSGPNPDKVILSRIIKLIKTWMQEQPQDFENQKIIELFEQFVSTLDSDPASKAWADQLRTSMEDLQHKEEFLPVNPPRSLVPFKKMNSQLLEFSDLPTLEVARQITLLEFDIFRKIQPKELVRKAWIKKNKEELAPNVVSLIDRFNLISFWICYEIIKIADLTRRGAMLCKFISLCEELKVLRNFHGVMTVVSALNNSSISRLKNTWKEVPPKTLQMLRDHEALMASDSNYKNYRQCIAQNDSQPLLPFEGVFLTDLTFIDENEDFKEDNFINWEKMSLLGSVILSIQSAQKTRYHLEVIPPMQQYLRQGLVHLDNDKLYKLSRQIEPPQASPSQVISVTNLSHSQTNLTPSVTLSGSHSGSCIVTSNRIQKPSTSNPILIAGSLDKGPPSPLSTSPPSLSPFYSPPSRKASIDKKTQCQKEFSESQPNL